MNLDFNIQYTNSSSYALLGRAKNSSLSHRRCGHTVHYGEPGSVDIPVMADSTAFLRSDFGVASQADITAQTA